MSSGNMDQLINVNPTLSDTCKGDDKNNQGDEENVTSASNKDLMEPNKVSQMIESNKINTNVNKNENTVSHAEANISADDQKLAPKNNSATASPNLPLPSKPHKTEEEMKTSKYAIRKTAWKNPSDTISKLATPDEKTVGGLFNVIQITERGLYMPKFYKSHNHCT